MTFHSFGFVFAFLPFCLIGFLIVARRWGREAGLLWLVAASLYFHASWGPQSVVLLVISILGNYAFAQALASCADRKGVARALLVAAVAANLALLGFCKYVGFFIGDATALFGTSASHVQLLLPLGVSFYTLIQIGYLVAIYKRQARPLAIDRHTLFAGFFAFNAAGPVVLHKDMVPQYDQVGRKPVDLVPIAAGLTVFAIGLFKKLALADALAPHADAVFNGVASGGSVDAVVAWVGALAYTLQLYFDFSGYCDMALGLGCMFGLRLPLNFDSPFKAVTITDFWRRWHMTMARFVTGCLFAPMAIGRRRRSLQHGDGPALRFLGVTAAPALYAVTLVGLWHGAGWTFVLFGLLHGLAVAVHHGWRQWRPWALPISLGWGLTMAVVIAGMVLFRSDSLASAGSMLAALGGITGAGHAPVWLSPAGLREAVGLIAVLGAIVLLAPNTQQLMRQYKYWHSSDPAQEADAAPGPAWLAWRPSPAWAAVGALLLVLAISAMGGEARFFYYAF
jgi:D-alanyl-lipoteichoic acid acyltransferase DltB (MBOAT superfamily)